jgi:hypothetical protein
MRARVLPRVPGAVQVRRGGVETSYGQHQVTIPASVMRQLANADDEYTPGPAPGYRYQARQSTRKSTLRNSRGLTHSQKYANIGMWRRMKKLTWIADSRSNVKSFPAPVQDGLGFALYVAQLGEMSAARQASTRSRRRCHGNFSL